MANVPNPMPTELWKEYALFIHLSVCPSHLNSLVPGTFKCNFIYVIFNLISVIDGGGISCKIVLRNMSTNFTDDKSTLVGVMACCHQATSHYLSQCWPKYMPPYGVTRARWFPHICRQITNVIGFKPCGCIHTSGMIYFWLCCTAFNVW